MVLASASMALSWPNTSRFRSLSIAASTSASDLVMVLGGMRAMVATVASTSLTPIFFLRLASGTSICEAPVSSITSIALSGSLRSWMYLADSSTAALMASLVYLSLWYSSNTGLRPFRISMESSTVGSLMSIFWKRRTSARSFSKCWRYSL